MFSQHSSDVNVVVVEDGASGGWRVQEWLGHEYRWDAPPPGSFRGATLEDLMVKVKAFVIDKRTKSGEPLAITMRFMVETPLS